MSNRKVFGIGLCTVLILLAVLGSVIGYKTLRDYSDEDDLAHALELTDEQNYYSSLNQEPWKNMRLPDWIEPTHYLLDLYIDMYHDAYNGQVSVDIDVKSATKTIIFHQLKLNITHMSVFESHSMKSLNVKNSFSYEKNEFYVAQLKKYLKVGEKYTLLIFFRGQLRPELNGFYKSYYNSAGNERRKVVSTFFSPIYARKAFPCFDEPKFKANFTLSLTHSSKYHALSNMPVASKRYINGKVITTFQTTLKMSTYILCWVVSDFKSLTIHPTPNLVIRSWTSLKNLPNTKYGLETTAKLLKYYESYFQIPFPLNKLDIIAVPNFAAGAMENWGIITFQQSRLIFNAKKTSQSEKQNIFHIISHELVHQWFGNLATMKFWTDAWLKEGFANYIGQYGGEQIEPTMEFMKKSLTDIMIPALEMDSYASSHPISTSASTPDEIREIFDIITYQKGHCMVQMLHEYLGKDFQRGLQRYLKTYSYKNADQDDLWRELSAASGKDVKSVMDTWTLQLGYPVITVTLVNKTFIKLTQERFSLDPENTSVPTSNFNYIWQVPITYRTVTGSKLGKYLLKTKEAFLKTDGMVVINLDHALFYRINYKNEMLDQMKKLFKSNQTGLSKRDRVGLISDQFSMAAANLSKLAHALDMADCIKNETDYYPWKETLKELSNLYRLTENTQVRNQLRTYIKNLITTKMGWKVTKTFNEGLLQVLLLQVGCSMNMSNVKNDAENYYGEWMMNRTMKVSPSLYSTIRDCVLTHASETQWDFAFNKYAEGGSESIAILTSLTYTQNKTLIKRLLSYTNDDTKINSQDAPRVIGQLASHGRTSRQITWEHLKKSWQLISRKYKDELFIFSSMLTSVLEKFSTKKELQDIENFFANRTDLGSGKQAVSQAIIKIKSNIKQKQIYSDQLDIWLKERML